MTIGYVIFPRFPSEIVAASLTGFVWPAILHTKGRRSSSAWSYRIIGFRSGCGGNLVGI